MYALKFFTGLIELSVGESDDDENKIAWYAEEYCCPLSVNELDDDAILSSHDIPGQGTV